MVLSRRIVDGEMEEERLVKEIEMARSRQNNGVEGKELFASARLNLIHELQTRWSLDL